MTAANISELVRQVERRIAAQRSADRPQPLMHTVAYVEEAVPLFSWPRPKSAPRFVLGVSTYNRLEYLRKFVETFEETRSDKFEWVLIIADDGSNDGTVDYMRALHLPDVSIIKIFNKGARIAGQTNSILLAADALAFDFGVKCDDDVFFVGPGWDSGYFQAATDSGFDHLVFHDTSWKPAEFHKERGQLVARITPPNAMGCLWTFTPRLITDVGFFDERSFPVRGHSHLDFTARATRFGFNQSDGLWDWQGASEVVTMWARDNYLNTVDWRSEEVRSALSPDDRERREKIIQDDRRGHLPFDPLPHRPLPLVEVTDDDSELLASLTIRGFAPLARGQLELYDEAFVLNLPHHRSRWMRTASSLARASISFRRADTVDGYARDPKTEWARYTAAGLTHPVEKRIGRKLIESAGAWGYLSSAENVIESAMRLRLNRILMFDDDILLANEFELRLEALLEELPEEWRLIYLGASSLGSHRRHQVSNHLIDPGNEVNGSFAVAIDSSVFNLLKKSIAERSWPFDSGPLRDIRDVYPGQVFAARPELVIADVSTSSIRKQRDLDAFSMQMGWDLADFDRDVKDRQLQYVSVVIWAGPEAAFLRETLRSLRFQYYAWFRALVIVHPDWMETRRVAVECQDLDPRIQVLSVEAADSATGFGAVQELIAGDPVAYLYGGDILFPDHLSRMLESLDEYEVSVPAAINYPQGALVNGQFGMRWERVREALRHKLGLRIRPTRSLISIAASEEVGDFPAWSEYVTAHMLANQLDTGVVSHTEPTMIAISTHEAATRSEDDIDPYYLSPGRSYPVTVIRDLPRVDS